MATTETEVVSSPQDSEIVKKSLVAYDTVSPTVRNLVITAREFVIASDEDMVTAQTRIVEAQRHKKVIEELFRPLKEDAKASYNSAKSTWDRVKGLIKMATGPCDEIKAIYGAKGVAYKMKRDREIAEEQRKREEEAKREAEERKLSEAVHAEAMGDQQAADEILDEPSDLPVIPQAPAIARADGVRFTERWKAQGVDIIALCKAVAERRVPPTYVLFNLPALNLQARSLRSAMNIPGVKAVCEKTMEATGK